MAYDYFRVEEKDFDDVYEIMTSSFPHNEMRDKEEMYRLFRENHQYSIYGMSHQDKTAAFIVVWKLEGFIFIENFATQTKYRGKGIGGALLDIVLKRHQMPAILEVEPPDDILKSRRVLFYERHGFKFNDFDYKMPPLHKGEPPLPLKIMSYPMEIPEKMFAEFKKQIYGVVYKDKA